MVSQAVVGLEKSRNICPEATTPKPKLLRVASRREDKQPHVCACMLLLLGWSSVSCLEAVWLPGAHLNLE